jgi:CheY-like chemotaxis protein
MPAERVTPIEDDPEVRGTVRQMLESWKLDVIEAANGLIGLALFCTYKPSLLITDILMPEMDGIETLRELRATDPQAKVIAMSGGGGDKYPNPLALAKELGVVAVLEKPFRRKQLRAAVDQILPQNISV